MSKKHHYQDSHSRNDLNRNEERIKRPSYKRRKLPAYVLNELIAEAEQFNKERSYEHD